MRGGWGAGHQTHLELTLTQVHLMGSTFGCQKRGLAGFLVPGPGPGPSLSVLCNPLQISCQFPNGTNQTKKLQLRLTCATIVYASTRPLSLAGLGVDACSQACRFLCFRFNYVMQHRIPWIPLHPIPGSLPTYLGLTSLHCSFLFRAMHSPQISTSSTPSST